MSDSHLRQLASTRKHKSYKELATQCKRIEEGKDKCFELSIGGFNLSNEECKLSCQAAVKAASSEKDQYRKVSALLWPVRVYAVRGMHFEANKLAGIAFNQAQSVTPSNSRAYVLEALSECVWDLDPKWRKSIFKQLIAMIDCVPGWRIARACAHIAGEFDQIGDSEFVDELLSKCKNNWLIGRVERDRAKR
ncbi:MAG: hypothetical protein P1U42_04575 [Phycisphaerales bacterium]|nr:hypothetical protein [Phycisphaerales bacterium]